MGSWRAKYPLIYQSRNAAWPGLCEFFKYPEEIRRAVYTTNATEPLNYPLRKVTRNRSALASGVAIYKIMCLALRNAAKNGPCRLRTGGRPSTGLRCFQAGGFRSCEFYLHKTIDRPCSWVFYYFFYFFDFEVNLLFHRLRGFLSSCQT
jgi:hypothetical protein